MVPEKLPDIIISTLGFNASVLALLFAAQGFVLARMWPEGGKFFRMRLLWIVPPRLCTTQPCLRPTWRRDRIVTVRSRLDCSAIRLFSLSCSVPSR